MKKNSAASIMTGAKDVSKTTAAKTREAKANAANSTVEVPNTTQSIHEIRQARDKFLLYKIGNLGSL